MAYTIAIGSGFGGSQGQGDFLCRYKYNIARMPLFKFVLSPICSICLSGLNFFLVGWAH